MKPSQKLPLATRLALRFALTMADTPHIEGRVRAVIEKNRPRRVLAGAVAGAIAGATVFSLMLAALRPAPPPPDPTPARIAEIERQLKEIRDELHRPSLTIPILTATAQPPKGHHADWVRVANCTDCHRAALKDQQQLDLRTEKLLIQLKTIR